MRQILAKFYGQALLKNIGCCNENKHLEVTFLNKFLFLRGETILCKFFMSRQTQQKAFTIILPLMVKNCLLIGSVAKMEIPYSFDSTVQVITWSGNCPDNRRLFIGYLHWLFTQLWSHLRTVSSVTVLECARKMLKVP